MNNPTKGIAGPGFLLDVAREARIGLPEAIFCAGKTPDQIEAILDRAPMPLLLTRLDPARHASLPERWRARLDWDPLSLTAFSGDPPPASVDTRIAVVAAGTSDLAVASEAIRTLRFAGASATLHADVGVAGLWRLLDRIDAIGRCPVAIAVAGMDAALPSVLAGLVPSALIAVPTSVGYGVAAGGRAALDSILASCAPGIAVTNIDNGYGAACAALRILRQLDRYGRTDHGSS